MDPCNWSSANTICGNMIGGLPQAPPVFSGNHMHANGSFQLEFQGGGTYFLDNPSGDCNPAGNFAYCYRNRGGYGADTLAIHADTTLVPPSCPAVVGIGASFACLEVWVNHFGFSGGTTNNQNLGYDTHTFITNLNTCTAASTCP
jgi:hypothetical protein